jgi:hypothetical protein
VGEDSVGLPDFKNTDGDVAGERQTSISTSLNRTTSLWTSLRRNCPFVLFRDTDC